MHGTFFSQISMVGKSWGAGVCIYGFVKHIQKSNLARWEWGASLTDLDNTSGVPDGHWPNGLERQTMEVIAVEATWSISDLPYSWLLVPRYLVIAHAQARGADSYSLVPIPPRAICDVVHPATAGAFDTTPQATSACNWSFVGPGLIQS